VERPKTVSNYVLDTIRTQILEGYYLPGSRLDQRALADKLKVSLIPVRESLRQLEAEGWVNLYPHRGAFVTTMSPDELQEIYLIRGTLEELITQLAVPSLSPETLRRLGELIVEMEHATKARDADKLLVLNRDFHFTIYEVAHRPLLIQIIVSLWDRSTRYRKFYTHLLDRAPQALAEHKQIYKACKAKDGAAAGRAVRNNVNQTTEGILSRIQSSQLVTEPE
jgi:DNA-binding GntR family transcriptional regulator